VTEDRIVAAFLGALVLAYTATAAVRNMVRADIDPAVAIKISGHRTRAMFDRYDITTDGDIRDSVLRLQTYVNGLTDRSAGVAAQGRRHRRSFGARADERPMMISFTVLGTTRKARRLYEAAGILLTCRRRILSVTSASIVRS